MFWYNFAILWSFLLVSQNSFAFGGHVGNGAGLVEHNIFYAYDSVPKAIQSCLSLPTACGVNQKNIQDLTRILEIAQSHPATPQRLVFVSEKAAEPGFFDTEVGQAHRIAKTDLTPDSIIYWNSDRFYRDDGSTDLDIPFLTAILIHELGHQAGILDHAYLDQIGSAVQVMWTNGVPPELLFQDTDISINLALMNFQDISSTADIYLTNGDLSYRLSDEIGQKAHCPVQGDLLLGWKIMNQHWDSLVLQKNNSEDASASLPFSAWFQVHCVRAGNLVEHIQEFHARFEFAKDAAGKYQFLKVD